MNISSMTGFARLKKSLSLEETDIGWTWEIRSVNGRFLDVKIKLPAIFEHLQQQLKTEAASCFSRGNVTATLMMENNDSDVQVRINEKLLEDLMTQLNAVSERISGKKRIGGACGFVKCPRGGGMSGQYTGRRGSKTVGQGTG